MKKYNFKKDKFCIIKKAVPKELCEFLYNYLLIKEEVLKKLLEEKYISPFENMHGVFGDDQIPNESMSLYGDAANDTLLLRLQNLVEKETKLKLIPTYSYSRNYVKGSELVKHKDRPSCAISLTMNVGGDPWPIFMEPKNKKAVKVLLSPGDIIIYRGCELNHWREPFEGDKCVQMFLHYTLRQNIELLYDKRPYLGLPGYFKKNENN
jgi:hypothetical protein|tara:strand:- start:344 stop:967 length:624 start_codon:yes stop_codon:yes gene_type:complete